MQAPRTVVAFIPGLLGTLKCTRTVPSVFSIKEVHHSAQTLQTRPRLGCDSFVVKHGHISFLHVLERDVCNLVSPLFKSCSRLHPVKLPSNRLQLSCSISLRTKASLGPSEDAEIPRTASSTTGSRQTRAFDTAADVGGISSGGGRSDNTGRRPWRDDNDGEGEITPPQPVPVTDGMTRYPELSVRGTLRGLDYFGTVIFAISGTLTAGISGMDLLGCMAVGTITAVGGGTVRDILLNKQPFWMEETEYLFMCLSATALTFFLWPIQAEKGMVKEEDDFFFWSDALGIGAFCVIGAQNGIRAGMHPLVSILCGMFTSTFGGLTRDVLCHRPVRILHSTQEIYATTALAGSSVYVGLRTLGAPLALRISGGFFTGVAMRYWAWKYGIRLPVFRNVQPAPTEQPPASDLPADALEPSKAQ